MTPPILYSTELSPPCRAVLLATAAAGIDIEVKETSLENRDHEKEEFIKMNPQHTIPTLDDNGFYLPESHAIVTYLIDKYAKDDSLYPKDLKKRALINRYLHFNNSVLFANVKFTASPIFLKGATEVSKEGIDRLVESCEFMEKFLGNNDWFVGDTYTLADICLVSIVSGLEVFFDLNKFPKLTAWIKRCENQIPGYATKNVPGNQSFMDYIRSRVRNL